MLDVKGSLFCFMTGQQERGRGKVMVIIAEELQEITDAFLLITTTPACFKETKYMPCHCGVMVAWGA